MAPREYVNVTEVDCEKLHFGQKVQNKYGGQQVPMYWDNTSNEQSNKLQRIRFVDPSEPLAVKWDLDSGVAPGTAGPPSDRRSLKLVVSDPRILKALENLDEAIIRAAVKNSVEWFKGKTLTEEQVRERYKSFHPRKNSTDDHETMQVKVKCGASTYPTKLHLRRELGGPVVMNGASIEHLKQNAWVVPLCSASNGLWFMNGGLEFGMTVQAEEMLVTPASCGDSLSQFASSVPLEVTTEDRDVEDGAPPNAKGALGKRDFDSLYEDGFEAAY
jgi:hypothetical protein